MPKSNGKGGLSKGKDKGNPSKGKGKDNQMGAYAWIWSPLCVAWHQGSLAIILAGALSPHQVIPKMLRFCPKSKGSS